MNYGQAIPGVTEGRGIGIIDTHNLPRVVDAVGLLRGSKAWTAADQKGMEQWFGQYLTWLVESRHGQDEARQKNNHGTWYDVQVASFALFVGKDALAEKVLRESMTKRVATLVEPDGRQPSELVRTNALSYSFFNLRAMFQLAALGEHVGPDLWNFQTADGRGIRRALDWLLPFAAGEREWTYKQITKWEPERLVPLLRQAAVKFEERKYEALAARLAGAKLTADRINLLFPLTKV